MPQSVGLWLMAGSTCASEATEGTVSVDLLAQATQDAGLSQAMGRKAAATLVASELWHDAKSIRRCEPCLHAIDGKLPAGAHYFHDWLEYQYTRDESKIPEVRWKAARMKALHRDHALKQAILERDGEHCRYCTIRVDFKARVGPHAGTYDHVDPSLRSGPRRDGNTLDNVVVACGPCNTTKKNRTPQEWVAEDPEHGRLLLAAPELAGARSGPGRDLVATNPGSSHTHTSHATRDGVGREQAPARSEPGLPVTNGNGAHA